MEKETKTLTDEIPANLDVIGAFDADLEQAVGETRSEMDQILTQNPEEVTPEKTGVLQKVVTILRSRLNDAISQIQSLKNKNKELEEENKRLEKLVMTDDLTGLENRRFFDKESAREFNEAERYGHDVTIAIVDIDHFKKINDTYGHKAGDKVLQEVANTIQKVARGSDIVTRYGGEEMALILPNTNQEEALSALEHIRIAVEELNVMINGFNPISVKVSGGVSEKRKGETVEDVFKRADAALYYSKKNGRNQIHVHAEGMEEAPEKKFDEEDN